MAEFEDLPSDVVRRIMEWTVNEADVQLVEVTDFESTAWCRLASVCKRWRSILVEIPISMELVWNPDAVQRLPPHPLLDPVHRALQQLVAQVARCPAPITELQIQPRWPVQPRLEPDTDSTTEGNEIGEALARVVADIGFRRRSGRWLTGITLDQGKYGPPEEYLHRDPSEDNLTFGGGVPGFECPEELDMSVFTSLWTLRGISGRLPRLPPSLRELRWGASRRQGAAPAEVALLQERLQLLPYLYDLGVRIVTSPGLPHLAVDLRQSLPPTVQHLIYHYGGDLHDPPLPWGQLYAHEPPNLSIKYRKSNLEMDRSNIREFFIMMRPMR